MEYLTIYRISIQKNWRYLNEWLSRHIGLKFVSKLSMNNILFAKKLWRHRWDVERHFKRKSQYWGKTLYHILIPYTIVVLFCALIQDFNHVFVINIPNRFDSEWIAKRGNSILNKWMNLWKCKCKQNVVNRNAKKEKKRDTMELVCLNSYGILKQWTLWLQSQWDQAKSW